LLSLGDTWLDIQKKLLPKMTDDEFKVLTNAPTYEVIDPENWTVNMSIVNDQGLKPALDRVLLGEDTAANIITAAAPDIQAQMDASKTVS